MEHKHLPHDHGQDLDRILRELPEAAEFQTLAEQFRQLSDGNRLRIFWLLCHCEACVVNLSAMVAMSPPAVSHHLKQLKTAGLIVSRRAGKEVYYRAADSSRAAMMHDALEALMAITCPTEE